MLYSLRKLLTVLSMGALSYGAIESDRVTSLPGYNGELPSTHYSGLIPVGEISGVPGHLHYWLIESENDPKNDPIVMVEWRSRKFIIDWFVNGKWSNCNQ